MPTKSVRGLRGGKFTKHQADRLDRRLAELQEKTRGPLTSRQIAAETGTSHTNINSIFASAMEKLRAGMAQIGVTEQELMQVLMLGTAREQCEENRLLWSRDGEVFLNFPGVESFHGTSHTLNRQNVA